MNAVLKAGIEEGRPQVQTFSERVRNGAPPAPPLNPEIDALTKENARLAETLRILKQETDEAIRAARSEGRAQAISEFQRDEKSALEALSKHLDEAFRDFRNRIETWDDLSLAVAQTALSKIIRAPEFYHPLLTDMIALQIGQVSRESIIDIRVSTEDFPDHVALQQLLDKLGTGNLQICSDESVRRGGCIIRLRIGEVESGLDLKWDALVSLFATLSGATRK